MWLVKKLGKPYPTVGGAPERNSRRFESPRHRQLGQRRLIGEYPAALPDDRKGIKVILQRPLSSDDGSSLIRFSEPGLSPTQFINERIKPLIGSPYDSIRPPTNACPVKQGWLDPECFSNFSPILQYLGERGPSQPLRVDWSSKLRLGTGVGQKETEEFVQK